ncbi:2,3-dihydroxybenzoate--coenzyme A ligase, putative [Geotalea daltonii FRC-32]|uniref:2,3-dihydroxybenzoate--coenzyme A ligase, putative n=1 Tax=Geotalea daltonii (strain DSM 22248 / JCM 15807 / FRC-32) TaxID=316067 RepID=B9M938_GEODF|nr:AMP-binding protein [Geotalea daltonii]ACM18596.1 2,3-dihydroxybenzoate--coenzyme A ligase, putative [Geotalea daltonii FRC-32]
MIKNGFTEWPEDFAQAYRDAGYWRDQTIGEVLAERFARFADRTALIAEDGAHYTYADLDRLSTRLALHFKNLGLQPYDRVIHQIPNGPVSVLTFLGLLKAGAVPVMTLPPHREAEIGHFARLSGARGYAIASQVREFDFQALAGTVQEQNPSLEFVLVTGGMPGPGYQSIDAMLLDPIEERAGSTSLPRPDPDFPAVLLLSGGTTGIPKLIPRTHNDYAYNFLRCAEVCGLDGETSVLVAVPQAHNFALACPGLLGTLATGGCELLSANTATEQLMKLIETHRLTHFIAVPTMILGLLDHPERGKYDLSSLRMILTGGSKLNPEVALRLRPELGCDVLQVLGMAEGPLYWTRLEDPDDVRLHTQGRPQSPGDEFRIVDPESGKEVAPGEVGELWCRGPHTIRGYYRADEHNTRAFSSDGFYKSGDLVRLHESGNIVVEGRNKDCINRGGEKISAEEIENHLIAHGSVLNCAVVAMPDAIFGEKCCAFVVPAPGASLTLEGLCDFLIKERKIARFKLPERLETLDALPLTNVGKINKKALREIIVQLQQAA